MLNWIRFPHKYFHLLIKSFQYTFSEAIYLFETIFTLIFLPNPEIGFQQLILYTQLNICAFVLLICTNYWCKSSIMIFKIMLELHLLTVLFRTINEQHQHQSIKISTKYNTLFSWVETPLMIQNKEG